MFCNRVVILPEFFIQLIFFLQFIHHVRSRVFGQMGGNRKNKLKSRRRSWFYRSDSIRTYVGEGSPLTHMKPCCS